MAGSRYPGSGTYHGKPITREEWHQLALERSEASNARRFGRQARSRVKCVEERLKRQGRFAVERQCDRAEAIAEARFGWKLERTGGEILALGEALAGAEAITSLAEARDYGYAHKGANNWPSDLPPEAE